jgi:hypothetical protein
MKRIIAIAGALLLSLGLLVPVVLAGEPLPHSGRVLVAVGGDITLPAGEQADTVIVVRGSATIVGEANTVLVVDGTARLVGARVENVFALRSPVTLDAGTVVLGDVRTLDAAVVRTGDSIVQGTAGDLGVDLAGIGLILGPAIFLWFLGLALAAIGAALLLAAVAARQVRAAETLISREPGATLLAGLAGLVIPPLVALVAIVTVVGAPLGIGILVGLWPLAAFVGYLVAGIWIGDWILRRISPAVTRERPYLAAVIGLVVLAAMAIVPPLTMIASVFGLGAVTLLAWRTFRERGAGDATNRRQVSAPFAR